MPLAKIIDIDPDLDEFEDNPVIIHSIKLKGKVYPPLCASCNVCCYARMSDNFDPFLTLVCGSNLRYTDTFGYCGDFDLDIGEWEFYNELIDHLDKHPELILDIAPQLYENDL